MPEVTRLRRRPPVALWTAAGLVGLAAVLPVFYLAVRALDGGAAGAAELLFRARTLDILISTAALILTVTFFSMAIALPVAWLTMRTDMPFRRVLSVVSVLPLVVPSFVLAMTAISVAGPRGMLQRALESPFGIERLPSIYGLPGATLVIVIVSYPYVLLTVRSALRRMDPSLEEASRTMGYGAFRTFRSVTLPLLRPALAAGALLAALYALSDFGAVALMRYETFTWAIFVQYESAFDRSIAATLSLVLVALAVVILLAEGFTRGSGAYHRISAGAVRPMRPVELGAWRWPAFTFTMIPVIAGLIIPVGLLLFWLVRGVTNGEQMLPLWGPTRNSVYVSFLAAVVTLAAAVPVAVLAVRYRSIMSRLIERATYIGFGLPGIVVALSLVFFGVNVALPLYQTTALLVVGYAMLFLPAAVGALRASLLQVSPRVEEAAQSLGRPQWRVILTVTLPLVMPGALAGAAIVFLMTMKELPATLILSPIGFKTLATSIWGSATEAFFARTAAPALLLILASGLPTAYLVLRDRNRNSVDVS